MRIVGELINASRKKVAQAIREQDADAIQALAENQRKCGADWIDVNAGVFVEKEAEYLKWLVENVQSREEGPCCIDSPNPAAIEAALSVHKGTAMINSISLEKDRFENLLPLLSGTDLNVVALCMSDAGMPHTADERLMIAEKLINELVRNRIPLENIYVDPLVQPVATDQRYGVEFLQAIEGIMETFPGCHTVCGLSNISYGLPERKLLNRTFMAMAISKGLDTAIVNPLDKTMIGSIAAAVTLSGRDEFCMNYIKAYRDGRIG